MELEFQFDSFKVIIQATGSSASVTWGTWTARTRRLPGAALVHGPVAGAVWQGQGGPGRLFGVLQAHLPSALAFPRGRTGGSCSRGSTEAVGAGREHLVPHQRGDR